MIPKIINYCWFGGSKLSELAIKCIESWKNYFPDYEIKEWNESNYDVNKIVFTHEAYKVKKYAFTSDYARFDILYNSGGLYFDTDVEVIKSYNSILNHNAFMGFEELGLINPGLGMGMCSGNKIAFEIMNYYEKQRFINKDGSYNLKTIVNITSDILKKHGLYKEDKIQDIAGIKIYPIEYFSPKSYETGITIITENTHSIHHFDGSWILDNENNKIRERWEFYNKYKNDEFV